MDEFKTGGYCPTCLHSKDNCTCFNNFMKIIENDFIKIIKRDDMDEKLKKVNLLDELKETMEDVEIQLFEDEKRWGNTWKERGLVFNNQSQETRFFNKIREYEYDYIENGTPVPWDKIIGEVHICKVREKKLS